MSEDAEATPAMLRVEDLISMAMGLPEKNTVNFKLLQTILYILARQMRLLGQEVELSLDGDGAEDGTDDGTGAGKRIGKKSSGLSVKERDGSGKGKILVVAKRSKDSDVTSEPGVTRVGSIDVVTQQQFQALADTVASLERMAAPVPPPSMPDNSTLRENILQGNTSLTDAMQAMQLTARVKAAEEAISQLSELLTELAGSGSGSASLPAALSHRADRLLAEVHDLKISVAGKEDKGVIGASGPGPGLGGGNTMEVRVALAAVWESGPAGRDAGRKAATATSAAATSDSAGFMAAMDTGTSDGFVTQTQMRDALRGLQSELVHKFNTLSAAITMATDATYNKAQEVAEKMETVVNINGRVNVLQGLMADYNAHINGLDSGFTAQMKGFQEQLVSMNEELNSGMAQLSAMTNTESSALKELRTRHSDLVKRLSTIQTEHTRLQNYQKMLSDDLQGLVESTELLREEKADRDEVLDGLRDKADRALLGGLLTELELGRARRELDTRIQLCYDKFRMQEQVWNTAIEDLYSAVEPKAALSELVAMRDGAQEQLEELQRALRRLAQQLGEPKAAILCRKLSLDGTCGVCRSTALMAMDTAGPAGAGPGAAGPAGAGPGAAGPAGAGPGAAGPAGAGGGVGGREGGETPVCTRLLLTPIEHADEKVHMCHRYVGGSHTVVPLLRERGVPAVPTAAPRNARPYLGKGRDGKMYQLEEEMLPCEECNKMAAEDIPGGADLPIDGRGDGVLERRVTISEEPGQPPRVTVHSEAEGSADQDRFKKASEESRPSIMKELRLSIMAAPTSATLMEFVTDQLGDIGDVVKGRVTAVGGEAAMRASVLQDIKEIKAAEGQELDLEWEREGDIEVKGAERDGQKQPPPGTE